MNWLLLRKRAFDAALVLVTTPLWLPLLVLVAALVRLRLGSPVLFRQKRPGYQTQPFTLLKFRTMVDGYDSAGVLLPDAVRLTAFGRWLRSTSLDRLPEVFNVLAGQIGFIGPRPLLMGYLTRYSPRQRRRHDVLPGITGWAQVNGRNSVSWPDRFEMDLWYVDHQSFWLDWKILVLTIVRALQRDGINQPGQSTQEEFRGDPSHRV